MENTSLIPEVITVKWQIEDGYVGQSRPQSTKVYLDDDWNELTDEEKKTYIDEAVQEDFAQKVSYSISDYGF